MTINLLGTKTDSDTGDNYLQFCAWMVDVNFWELSSEDTDFIDFIIICKNLTQK